jgi:hypothetical protein
MMMMIMMMMKKFIGFGEHKRGLIVKRGKDEAKMELRRNETIYTPFILSSKAD